MKEPKNQPNTATQPQDLEHLPEAQLSRGNVDPLKAIDSLRQVRG